MKHATAILSFLVAGTFAACSGPAGPNCLDYASAGIVVEPQDADTNGGVPAEVLIVVTSSDSAYTDSATLRYEDYPRFYDARFAWERPGTYRVEVTAQRYEPWVAEAVEVPMDEVGCHVETVRLRPALAPLD